MSKTVRQVFEMAMSIADSLNNSGQAITGDNLEYQNRTPAIINLLQGELARKGKLFNIIEIEYKDGYNWKEVALPKDFNIASNIIIDDNGTQYKSVEFYFEDKMVEYEDEQGNIELLKEKHIFLQSPRQGIIKIEYIPNPVYVTSIDDELEVSDEVCTSVLPYGLTAMLFLDENSALASFCQQKFEENKDASNNRLAPSVLEDIKDAYTNCYERGGY